MLLAYLGGVTLLGTGELVEYVEYGFVERAREFGWFSVADQSAENPQRRGVPVECIDPECDVLDQSAETVELNDDDAVDLAGLDELERTVAVTSATAEVDQLGDHVDAMPFRVCPKCY
nr:hypothetical protein [Nonomuraea sp. NEAU-A123]